MPSFAKNFYKGTFAVWGALGLTAVIVAALFSFRKRNLINANADHRKIINRAAADVIALTQAVMKRRYDSKHKSLVLRLSINKTYVNLRDYDILDEGARAALVLRGFTNLLGLAALQRAEEKGRYATMEEPPRCRSRNGPVPRLPRRPRVAPWIPIPARCDRPSRPVPVFR